MSVSAGSSALDAGDVRAPVANHSSMQTCADEVSSTRVEASSTRVEERRPPSRHDFRAAWDPLVGATVEAHHGIFHDLTTDGA